MCQIKSVAEQMILIVGIGRRLLVYSMNNNIVLGKIYNSVTIFLYIRSEVFTVIKQYHNIMYLHCITLLSKRNNKHA